MTDHLTFACNIAVDGDPFQVPWRFTLRRPGRAPYSAQCHVRMGKTPSGDPWIRADWLGPKLPRGVRTCLETAMHARLLDVLPADYDLIKLTEPLGTVHDRGTGR